MVCSCSETEPENAANALPLSHILDTLTKDLVKRGRLTAEAAASVKPIDLAMLILDEYTRMPVPESWMPYNYCMAEKFTPAALQPIFSLLGCKNL